MLKRTIRIAGLLGALLVAPGLVACGPKQDPNVAQVTAGAMPQGAEWRGVYYNVRYGFLHLTDSGNAINGAWRNTEGDKWGDLHGEVDGNLLRFEWTEHKVGVVGPNATSHGKGYFQYVIVGEDASHELKGEWGLNEKEYGNPWDAVKQKNLEPDPASVRPDNIENRVGAVGFDGSGSDTELEADDGEKAAQRKAAEEAKAKEEAEKKAAEDAAKKAKKKGKK
jgi:hypothetical protein